MTFKQYFISKFPEEAVGYLKGGEFFPLENLAADKLHSFEVDPSFILNEPELLLHSHVTGHEVQEPGHDPRAPSFTDLQYQIATDIEWGICVTDGQTCDDPITWGNPKNRPALEGRDFIFNIQDCLSLLQDWMYAERGVELPNEPRHPFWASDGQNYMEDLHEKYGFVKVNVSELQRGDVLFYKVRTPVVNHLGIYLGDNQVLSHWYGRVSAIEGFGKWAEYIQFAARYQGAQ